MLSLYGVKSISAKKRLRKGFRIKSRKYTLWLAPPNAMVIFTFFRKIITWRVMTSWYYLTCGINGARKRSGSIVINWINSLTIQEERRTLKKSFTTLTTWKRSRLTFLLGNWQPSLMISLCFKVIIRSALTGVLSYPISGTMSPILITTIYGYARLSAQCGRVNTFSTTKW